MASNLLEMANKPRCDKLALKVGQFLEKRHCTIADVAYIGAVLMRTSEDHLNRKLKEKYGKTTSGNEAVPGMPVRGTDDAPERVLPDVPGPGSAAPQA